MTRLYEELEEETLPVVTLFNAHLCSLQEIEELQANFKEASEALESCQGPRRGALQQQATRAPGCPLD